jgi:lipopolysaccharide/colanic/teichoic acid biosynthesis glycosyltransferase
MSLIGPRPERPEFLPKLEKAIPHYRDRLQVRPGITGLAQVQLPPDTDLASVRSKLAHDLYYVSQCSMGLDLRILLATLLHLLNFPCAATRKLCGLPTTQRVEQPYEKLTEEAASLTQPAPA